MRSMREIDKNGNEVVPCKYETRYDGFLINQKRIIYIENGKCGVKNFDDEDIIPPLYTLINDITDRSNLIIAENDSGTTLYEVVYKYRTLS